jgi:hypothetical protein
MKYVVIGIIVIVGAVVLWATLTATKAFVGGFTSGFGKRFVQSMQSNGDFHTAYRRGFKQSFLRSCEHGLSDARTQTYCTCVEDGLEKRFDDAGLMTLATSATSEQREAARQIVRACYLTSKQP